jgi:hypothetical protein
MRGTHYAKLIDNPSHVGEQVADRDAALSAWLEWKRRCQQLLRFSLSVSAWHQLPVVLGERRLGIEGVHMGGSAVQEQEDDVLGPGGEMRWADFQRSGGFAVTRQNAGQSQHSKAVSSDAQEFTASHQISFSSQRKIR